MCGGRCVSAKEEEGVPGELVRVGGQIWADRYWRLRVAGGEGWAPGREP